MIFSSIRVKLSCMFVFIIGSVLIIMNTYLLTASRDMIFASKQSSMQNQAAVLASSLASLDNLTVEDVRQTMELLNVSELTRVIIADSTGQMLYDTTEYGDNETHTLFESNCYESLSGKDVFYSRFSDGAFSSIALSPIMRRGLTSGIVFVHEYDAEQGAILLGLQNTIRNFSLIISILTLLLLLFFLMPMMHRITRILDAIVSVREGEYNYRIQVDGSDELAQIGNEFNSLTSRLQQTEEVRRRFVADASHEMKTPLASIRLLSDSILQNEDMSDEMVREFVGDIGSESERLARTTEKLLALTRLDNKLRKDTMQVDIGEAVNSSIRMLRPLAGEKGITLDFSLDEGCIISANGDDLHEIIFNLVENAIKYNVPDGSVTVTLKKAGATALLIVDDTGIGIPEEHLPYIFDRFYRVDKARSREAGGSGLGLAIVKNTVLEYNGTIEAIPRSEGGMRFTVSFPLFVEEL